MCFSCISANHLVLSQAMAGLPYLIRYLGFCCHHARGLVLQGPQAIGQISVNAIGLDRQLGTKAHDVRTSSKETTSIENEVQHSICHVPMSGSPNSYVVSDI